MIEIISGAWAAGETKTFQIAGQYIEILDAQYSCDVVLMDRTGSQQSFMRGAEASFFTRPGGGFETVQITSAQAQTIRVFVGSGDAGTRRISSTVQVVDGGRARTLAGAAFCASFGIGPPAGEYSLVQLFNPAGSGVRMMIKSYMPAIGLAGGAVVGFQAVELATTAQIIESKLCNGAPSKAKLRVSSNGARQLPGARGYVDYMLLQAASSMLRVMEEPIVLVPGFGIAVECHTQGAQLNATFEWTEEAI